MSINSVTISGNIVREPELKQTRSGASVLAFSVAMNERRKNGDQWEDYANFIDCTMFGSRAEKMAQYLHKGTKVSIQGKVHQDRWQDKQTGANRSRIGVLVDQIEFMSRGNGQQQAAAQPLPQVGQAQLQQVPLVQQAPQQQAGYVYDDDVPF